MMRSTFALSVLATFLSVNSNAQKLSNADFRVGALKVNGKINLSLLSKDFGGITKVDTIIQTHRTPKPETTYVYYFDSLTVDVLDRVGIRTIEFISRRLTTHRGVRIGDTVEKVRSSYGTPSEEYWGLGCPSGLSYYEKNSTLGLNFCIANGRVVKIVVGWGGT